jgi:hypothetical protein
MKTLSSDTDATPCKSPISGNQDSRRAGWRLQEFRLTLGKIMANVEMTIELLWVLLFIRHPAFVISTFLLVVNEKIVNRQLRFVRHSSFPAVS